MDTKKKAYLELHFSVFLWGFTAILGRLIELRELPLVWYRVLITCCSLILIPGIWKHLSGTTKKDLIRMGLIGCLICTHWLCFYGSIKYSNISIALSCLATSSFMTSFIEPFVNRKRVKGYEILLGLIITAGMYIIFHFSKFYLTGIILGLLAAFLAGLFTTLNKFFVEKQNPFAMTFIELGSGFIFLSFLLPFYLRLFPHTVLFPSSSDMFYLFCLALFCTTLPFVLSLHSLRHLSAFTSTFAVNMEPIYGIILAIIIFNENSELNPGFYAGTLIILFSMFLHPYFEFRAGNKKPVK